MNNVRIDNKTMGDMIIGIAELSLNLRQTVFEDSSSGILNADPNLSPGENAMDFVNSYADMISGALQLIGSTAKMIATAILNENIMVGGSE